MKIAEDKTESEHEGEGTEKKAAQSKGQAGLQPGGKPASEGASLFVPGISVSYDQQGWPTCTRCKVVCDPMR
eukprot:8388444-Lingulodinium_polyedra.AAC.1